MAVTLCVQAYCKTHVDIFHEYLSLWCRTVIYQGQVELIYCIESVSGNAALNISVLQDVSVSHCGLNLCVETGFIYFV